MLGSVSGRLTPKSAPVGVVGQEALEGGLGGRRIERWHDDGAGMGDLSGGTDGVGQDRQPEGHRLEIDQSERLVV
jgi:hypothetical protein